MIISNINNTNIRVIMPSNAAFKRANTNKITIVNGNTVPKRLDTYITTIQW